MPKACHNDTNRQANPLSFEDVKWRAWVDWITITTALVAIWYTIRESRRNNSVLLASAGMWHVRNRVNSVRPVAKFFNHFRHDSP